MLLRTITFIAPCLPSPAERPPSGPGWLHEIKHDGYRLMARRNAAGVRLLTRNGHDWTGRYSLIAQAAEALAVTSCLIDGEAVACDDDGLAVFERLRDRRHDASVLLYAFDLLELDGKDLRREPLQVRKATLASVLAKTGPGIRFNGHLEYDDGETVFRHACQLGARRHRLEAAYRSGRSPDWLKSKNPNARAVKREAEEDWGK